MAQNVLSISEFEDFNEWKRDGNVIRNSDGSYSTQDANFRNRLEDMEELQRYYKREFVGSYAKGGFIPQTSHKDKTGKEFTFQGGKFLIVDFAEYQGAWSKRRGQTWRKTARHITFVIKLDDVKTDLDKSLWDKFQAERKLFYDGQDDEFWMKYDGLPCREIYGNSAKMIDTLTYEMKNREYAKGGKMENMYKIVDIDGDTVESNLNEQEVIDFADSLGYYEAQDNEEEPIYDIDSAISLIEMEGDYTVVKMSEYGGSVYAKGGKITPKINAEIVKRAEVIYANNNGSTKEDFDLAYAQAITESGYDVEEFISTMNEIGAEHFDDEDYFYAKGGMVDLFEDFEKMPKNVREIVERYQDEFGGDMDYKDTQNMLNELEAVGYTFDYYLDNEPYGLRPIGTPLSALKGYEDEEYAKGGKVAKFDAYEVAGELAELADGVWDKLKIQSGGELYNDESLQAKVNEEYAKAGIDEMFKALSTVNRKKVAEALTDENNHNVRNYLALRGYLGVAEKRSYTKLFKESGKFKIVLNPTIFGVKPLVSDISTYVPHSKVLSITIKKGDKEYKLTGNDILDGVYVKDGEFKRGGVMKTLRRWWKKLNGTWYYNEGAGWRRDRKFHNKSEKYEKDGRKNYKQVTRGYVDDMPYEYAKGGYVDMREKLTKELMKLQRELNSSRLNSYFEGDTSEAEMARRRERESKLARFNDILKTLNEMDKSPKYAKGGEVTIPEKIEYSSMFSAIPRSTDNEKVV